MYLNALDELDQKIIQLLIENARISYSDIGKETGISRVAVKARIQALEKKGIIEEYRTVHKLSDFVLAAAGFWILYETIKIGVNEYKELNALNTLVSFMIPIVYLILIIPLEYALELYSKYELLFVRMAFKEEKNKKVKRRRRISIIRACKLSVHRVLLFQREYYGKMYVTMKDKEFEQLMKDFRNTCKKRNDV